MRTNWLVLACLSLPLRAAAEPTVVVGTDVPFSADELSRAVVLRGQPSSDVTITRTGDTLVVQVGATSQRISLCACESRDAARLVAMVIVALDGRSREPDGTPAPPPELGVDREMPGVLMSTPPPVTAQSAPASHRFSARVTIGRGRDDNGTYTTPLTGALAYALTSTARLVASASIMKGTIPRPAEKLTPFKLGLEGHAGSAGLELGGFVAPVSDCFGTRTTSYGGYATGRVYVGVTDRYRLVLEANGYWAVDQPFGCERDISDDPMAPFPPPITATSHGKVYGGALGMGLEWQL